ncbi:MAG: glycoside hydrolase family 127 protein [Pseudomonadota bacterium]|nr:glycoside hydrolase family 127 protein [Pseudomonadota bacterium]
MGSSFERGRREMLKAGALLFCGGAIGAAGARRALGVDAPAPLEELRYAQVKFEPGPVYAQAQENHQLVMSLDEDSLLRPFRQRAGLPAPGTDLGGWYDTYAFAPGATFGQWICALARYYAASGDEPTRAKVQRLVRRFADTVDTDGKFYRDNRFPAYIYDKLAGGLIDAKLYAHDDSAVATLSRATQAAIPYLPPHAMPRNEHAQPGQDFSQHAWDESYTLPENQFFAAHLTGDRIHLELARRFLYDDFFLALARGDNVLPGKHAYSHVNGLSSAACGYLALGQSAYFDAARQGFDFIDAQSFATGGWGPDEHFVTPGSGALGASLGGEHKSFETPCGAYAHFKLTRYLLRITRDPRYGDSMERVLYNCALGAKPIQSDGNAFYYSDYTRSASKTFHPDRWPCCSGTLPMLAADYPISACFTDPRGIYVNLYIPGHINWRQNTAACRLSIVTEYPYAGAVAMTLQLSQPRNFTLRLRIPAWATGARVAVNGKPSAAPMPGTFASIEREWRSGDRVELDLPLRQRLQAVDVEHPNLVALSSGPLVLMRIIEEGPASTAPLPRSALLAAEPVPGDKHQWTVSHDSRKLQLRAFADIDVQRYSAYQDVAG